MIQTWEEKLETSEDKNQIKLKGRKGVDKWDFSDRFYAILHQIPKCFDKDETKKTRLIEINLDEANAPNAGNGSDVTLDKYGTSKPKKPAKMVVS